MNIVITGTSRGLGNQLALSFSENKKNKVIGISRKSSENLSSQSNISQIQFDLELTDKIDELINQIKSEVSHIDILINNAGLLINKPFEELTHKEWSRIFQLNVIAAAELTKQLLGLLKLSKNPHILNISSMGGIQGSAKFNGLSAYSSSKAALIGITECLAEELSEHSIKVNAIALGAVQTEMLSEAFPGYKAPVTPLEIAPFIAHFAENGHRFCNGKTIQLSASTP